MLQTVISLLTLCIILSTLTPLSSARQIRISRYNVQVTEDGEAQEINATVREVTPYPAAGYRPGRAFKLPIETTTAAALPELPMTTELALDDAETTVTTETENEPTTTESYSIETTTTTTETTSDDGIEYYENEKTFRGYPARGYEPRVPFNLPTQNKNVRKNIVCNNTLEKIDATAEENVTPYPAAGYRPCQPFILPTENEQQQQRGQQGEQGETEENKNPACGVSLNPLAPKPPAGSVDEPDAERVPVTTNTGNGKSNVPIVASVANPAFVSSATLKGPQPIIWQQPLTVVPQQPFVYTTHFQTW